MMSHDVLSRLAKLTPEKREVFERLVARRSASPVAAEAPEPLEFGDPRSPAELRAVTRRLYDTASRQLDSTPVGRYACFMNLGYVPDGSPEYSVVRVPERLLSRNAVRLVLELIGDCPIDGLNILDVGCGRGAVAFVAEEYFKPGSFVGADLSFGPIAYCHRTHKYANAAFVQADAEQLPFRSGYFDVVTNLESSNHYLDLEAFYREVFRLLKPGGKFLYSDCMPADFSARWLVWLRATGFQVEVHRDITHNVLLACDESSPARFQAFGGDRNRFEVVGEFLSMPGSQVYRDMQSDVLSYRILRLMKPK